MPNAESSREAPGAASSKVGGFVLGALAFSFLAVSILLLNILQVLSVLVWPFSRTAFYAINEAFAYGWWGSIVFIMEKLAGISMHFTGEDLPSLTNSIVICNHQGMADIPALFCLAWRKKRLSALKWFVKDVFKYVPGAGWGMLFLNNVFVKRDWLRDQASIARVFANLKERHRPFWLVSFLEGTRFTKEKLARSQEYSRSRQLPVLQHVLAPRTKGFVASMMALRHDIDGVYDVTLGFPGGRPTLFGLFVGRCRAIHFHLRRFPVDVIPHEEALMNVWVWERYVEKDGLMSFFAEHQRFPHS